jgi:serine/threonine protein phosphatase PrpC
MTPLPSLTWAVTSDPGLKRTSNEDSYSTRPDVGLFVVADGMGGHVAGEVASPAPTETGPGRSRSIPPSAWKPIGFAPPFD